MRYKCIGLDRSDRISLAWGFNLYIIIKIPPISYSYVYTVILYPNETDFHSNWFLPLNLRRSNTKIACFAQYRRLLAIAILPYRNFACNKCIFLIILIRDSIVMSIAWFRCNKKSITGLLLTAQLLNFEQNSPLNWFCFFAESWCTNSFWNPIK